MPEELETGVTQVDPDRMEQAIENTEPIIQAGKALANYGVAKAAQEVGRTVEEQWERMGDRYAYQAAEMDPNQKQLDDYEVRGEKVEVRP